MQTFRIIVIFIWICKIDCYWYINEPTWFQIVHKTLFLMDIKLFKFQIALSYLSVFVIKKILFIWILVYKINCCCKESIKNVLFRRGFLIIFQYREFHQCFLISITEILHFHFNFLKFLIQFIDISILRNICFDKTSFLTIQILHFFWY